MAEPDVPSPHAVPIQQRIEDKLRSNLKVDHLASTCDYRDENADARFDQELTDTSGNCGSSFAVIIVSPDFAQKMTLARHKMSKFKLCTVFAIVIRLVKCLIIVRRP